VLVVAATPRELAFVEDAETLCCGVGPVEAALATARALCAVRPPVLLHVGIAGARRLEAPTLVLGSEAVYCDLVDPGSAVPRLARVDPDPGLLAAARRALPGALVVPIATSARIGGGAAFEIEAMEGFGVLRAAAAAGVPALELRAVSNGFGEPRERWRIEEALDELARALGLLIGVLDA
jgi:futalosine hydrolase